MATLEGLENPPSRPEVAAGRRLWPRLASLPLIPSLVIGVLLMMALAAPLLAPYPPTEQNLADRLRPPAWVAGGSMAHPFGTDLFGRDVLSRVVYGARVSLSVAIIAILVAGAIGTAVGLVAGYFGGVSEMVLMRVVDAFLAVPAILVVIVIGLLYWPRYARQIRAETLSIKERDYVQLARIAGCSPTRILATHVLPNLVPSLLVLASLQVG